MSSSLLQAVLLEMVMTSAFPKGTTAGHLDWCFNPFASVQQCNTALALALFKYVLMSSCIDYTLDEVDGVLVAISPSVCFLLLFILIT